MNYYHAASRKFCCCLPVRLGVFVLSAISAAASGFSAFAIWYTVVDTAHKGPVDSSQSNLNWNSTQWQNSTLSDYENQLDHIALDKQQYYAFIVIGIIVTIYCLFSIFGFLGALFARRALVAFYSTALWVLLVVNLVSGIYSCRSIVQRRQNIVNECLAQTNNDSNTSNIENKLTSASCNAASKVGIVIAIVVFVIQWLIQLYACIIVKRYVEQLGEEQGYRRQTGGNRINKGGDLGGYYAHQPLQNMPAGPYPYTHEDHSYGGKV